MNVKIMSLSDDA